ncbi:MAG: hydantoinase/oxoprolinase family protein [Gammaproteobacteria bacterium]
MPPHARLAVDIGGTFTDIALEVGNAIHSGKVLTTPRAPEEAVMEGIASVLAEAAVEPAQVQIVIHGTTLATNTIIERKGARTALVTTEGFRDSVEMGYEHRFEQYDIYMEKPLPLVPRYLRLPITERVSAGGEVLVALDEQAVRALVPVLEQHEIESVAIGFIHAYANPDHERRTAAILAEALPGLHFTLSSEVCPEVREYERMSTTCANAYVQPLMASYVSRLNERLSGAGFGCSLFLMMSGGALTTVDTAIQFPIRLVESGPAGGAILASHIARECDLEAVLSYDMGGTTAKICLIDHGRPQTSRTFEVDRQYRFIKGSGLPVRIPVIEMVEIGAGGGSIARVDSMSRIQVGPDSAGAEPGPACYDLGGEEPTVTDADVVLGRISPETFAGGSVALAPDAARRALDKGIGGALDMTSSLLAFAVSEMVDDNMSNAARVHAVELGKDLSNRALVAFGGAAPLHACRIAEKLGMNRVIVPVGAGVGSAIGFLRAPVAYDVVHSRYCRMGSFDPGTISAMFDEMASEARSIVEQGAPGQPLEERRIAYMRYVGQGHEIVVEVPSRKLEPADGPALGRAFDTAYEALFGRTIPTMEVEVLTWALTLSAPAQDPVVVSEEPGHQQPTAHGTRELFDAERVDYTKVAVFDRERLRPGMCIEGPAVITESQTATVITANFDMRVNALGYLDLKRRAPRGNPA